MEDEEPVEDLKARLIIAVVAFFALYSTLFIIGAILLKT